MEHEPFIRKAIELAITAGKKGNDTFGAVLAHKGQVIANTLYHPHPAFSPDGRQVFFCRRDAAGRNDVCLIDVAEQTSVQAGNPL